MSTTLLIFIVMLVCALCIISLWGVQLKRQRAIEKSRQNIFYTAQTKNLSVPQTRLTQCMQHRL
jgi:flagellar basal body-associated protein FliL